MLISQLMEANRRGDSQSGGVILFFCFVCFCRMEESRKSASNGASDHNSRSIHYHHLLILSNNLRLRFSSVALSSRNHLVLTRNLNSVDPGFNASAVITLEQVQR